MRDQRQIEWDALEANGFARDEPPTRRSDVDLSDYARETEALLARQHQIAGAQSLVQTARPAAASTGLDAFGDGATLTFDATVRVVVSREELEWFPIADDAAPVLAAIVGDEGSVREIIARAGLTADEGLAQLRALLDAGVLSIG